MNTITIKPKHGDSWESFTWIMFGMFLMRMGWTADEIDYERTLLKALGFNPAMTEAEMKKRYYPAVRIGATRRIPRKARIGVIFTYENACNHASFSFRDKEA